MIRKTFPKTGRTMILTPVLGKSFRDVMSAAKEAASCEPDGVEFRADHLKGSLSADERMRLFRALRDCFGERFLLFTWRTAAEGGLGEAAPDVYERLTREAVRSGCFDAIDLEEARIPQNVYREAKDAGMSVILSLHDFQSVPEEAELAGRFRRMARRGADAAKIACMPQNDADVMHLLNALRAAGKETSVPLIGIAMGERGAVTRVGGEVFGSAVTFAQSGRASAPGQFSVADTATCMERIRRHAFVRSAGASCLTGGSLFLTGFMGSGKSTVARILSEALRLPLYEMDEMIEQTAGMPIPDIFRQFGEGAFRDLESCAMLSLSGKPQGIVSCGGGVVTRELNRDLLKALGRTVCLSAEPEEIAERLRSEADGRPVLAGRQSADGIRELLEFRRPLYEAAADVTVRTDGKTPAEVAEEIRFAVEFNG